MAGTKWPDIIQVWRHPSGATWLISEVDASGYAFGFANLGMDEFAEWGSMDINELKGVGATMVPNIKPMPFKEAIDLIPWKNEIYRNYCLE